MMRYRLISIFLSKVGIDTGQLTWQDRQPVHDQTVSSWITLSRRPSSFLMPAAVFSHSPFRSWMNFLGESGFCVRCAGQRSWHRPHRVHASRSNICLQVKPSILFTPNSSAFSKSGIGAIAPLGLSSTPRNIMLREEVRICINLVEYAIYTMRPKLMTI